MPLSAGDKLGPYEIVAQIGAGGMGEVYRARDSKLNRDVAIKVLPAALANDAQYMARFEREAQVLASLNHPNIATVYGVEQGALVMEFVEGANLHGPMSLDEAIPIARQIAAGLEAAHERGVVHRDLKPANIKLTPAGVVKILDFGLAKVALESAGDPSSHTISPTLSLTMTQVGMILGTAAYMSPEQARGKPVDKRADIWAFGVVFYEMLTGKRLFEGEDLTETLASVVKDRPDLSGVPVQARRLLERCLEKDPKKRLRDIGDMELLLAAEAPSKPVSRSAKLPWIAAGVLALALGVALWKLWRAERPVDRPLVRLDIDLGADVSLPTPTYSGTSVVLSPDGTRLAYTSGTPPKLFIRRLDQPKAAELAGTQGAMSPFFSPDSQSVGFSSGSKLNKISVEGGALVSLSGIVNFAGATWSEDGSTFAGDVFGKGLLRFPAGGPPETVAGLANGEVALVLPQLLPGGKAVLFAAATTHNADNYTIEVVTLADRRRKIVARGGTSPRYLATSGRAGHLIYSNQATLFAIPFDLDKLETQGTAVAILDDVAYNAAVGTGQFDFSPAPNGHGTLVYRKSSGGSTMMTLQWVDPSGRKAPLLAKPGAYGAMSLSPDGKRVALMVSDGAGQDIWAYDPQRDAMSRLTFGPGAYNYPVWSADGKYVVFTSYGKGIFQARADGASQPQRLIESKATLIPCAFTPDGKRLAYDDLAANSQIWTVPLEEHEGQLKAGQPEPFHKSGFNDIAQGFSPDGRWLAYASNESGKPEVYVRAFPPPSSGQDGKWQISNGGGSSSIWSRNGHELVYRSGDDFMSASYTVKGDTFVPERPQVWIAKLAKSDWNLAPDGKRVLVVTPVESAEPPKQEHEVMFLENFADYLRQKVPVGK
jgi:serine/threonine-protein kinase